MALLMLAVLMLALGVKDLVLMIVRLIGMRSGGFIKRRVACAPCPMRIMGCNVGRLCGGFRRKFGGRLQIDLRCDFWRPRSRCLRNDILRGPMRFVRP